MTRGGADLQATLYTRHGCPPCFALRRLARRAARRAGIPLVEHEVSGRPDLEARFGSEVPVLVIPGQAPLKGKVGAAEVEAAFRRASGINEMRPSLWRRWMTAIGIVRGGSAA